MIYNRYIIKSLLKIFAVTLMVAAILVWLTQSMRFLDLITGNGLGFINFLKMSLLLIIPICFIMIPVAQAIATITLLNQLIQDREIVVMRSVGMSNYSISKPIIIFSVFIMLAEYCFSFYLLPVSYKEFKDLQQTYRNQLIGMFLEEGVFNNQLSQMTVYIDKRLNENYYKGIFIYNNQNPVKPTTVMANSGYLILKEGGPEFILYNGVHQERNTHDNKLTMVKFDSYNVKFTQAMNDTSRRYMDSNEYFVSDLLKFRDFNNHEQRLHFINGNQRIIWPAFCLSLTLICSGLMLTSTFTRRFNSRRILLSSVVVAGFLVCSLILNNNGSRNIDFLYLMYLNVVISYIVGVITLFKRNA